MATKGSSKINFELQIKSIELLNGSLNLPTNPNAAVTSFNYNINIESRADAQAQLAFVIVQVEIKNADLSEVLGSTSVSCIYHIADFENVIKIDVDGKAHIPQPLLDKLNNLSLSTTRGIMFSNFKGTQLHGAVLPIVESYC